jgi:RimJ/RimL family protein N-acetyltransferase
MERCMSGLDSLRSERLRIRRFEPADAPSLAMYRSEPDVARFQSWGESFSLEAANDLIAAYAAGDASRPGWFQWAIERVDHPGIVGDIGVDLNRDGMQAVIGYTVAQAFQGRGYATEIIARLVEHLLVERGLHRLTAECDTRNAASVRLLERLGFRREGHMRSSTWINGEWCDDYVYALLADEWSRARATRPITAHPLDRRERRPAQPSGKRLIARFRPTDMAAESQRSSLRRRNSKT